MPEFYIFLNLQFLMLETQFYDDQMRWSISWKQGRNGLIDNGQNRLLNDIWGFDPVYFEKEGKNK